MADVPSPQAVSARRSAALGVAAMVVASAVWGLSPLYYKMLVHIPPLELLSHRAIWSLTAFSFVLAYQRRLGAIGQALSASKRAFVLVLLAGLMISTNWFVFIWSVGAGRVTEASFGYYIFPLVAVLFGIVFFGERLSAAKWVSVALAALAVVALGVGLGTPPWVSVILSVTFGFYGVLKKLNAVGPVVSVTAETLVLAPLAVVYLVYLLGTVGIGYDVGTWALLLFSGVLTAGPLILFSYASRRIGLATVGLIQYLNPTLQFLCAAVVFSEPVTVWHMVAFPVIWLALAIYSAASLWPGRSERKSFVAASTESATDTNSRSEASAKPSDTT